MDRMLCVCAESSGIITREAVGQRKSPQTANFLLPSRIGSFNSQRSNGGSGAHDSVPSRVPPASLRVVWGLYRPLRPPRSRGRAVTCRDRTEGAGRGPPPLSSFSPKEQEPGKWWNVSPVALALVSCCGHAASPLMFVYARQLKKAPLF